MTAAASMMSPSIAPDMDTNVVAVVVTVTCWPLAFRTWCREVLKPAADAQASSHE